MSMSRDITKAIVNFARKHNLSEEAATEILYDIRGVLEWDYFLEEYIAYNKAKAEICEYWDTGILIDD